MDLHAHLCSNEVIGFLGGKVDTKKKSITIEQVRVRLLHASIPIPIL